MDFNSTSNAEADILKLNRHAMTLLRDQNFSKALASLKEASGLIDDVHSPDKKLKLQGITLNNFGCFYKRSKMPNVALKYLSKACKREVIGAVDNVNLAATHLNMCAIYSELGKHEIALQEGVMALELMKKSSDRSMNFVSTLVIGYHNTGVEYEFLKRYKDAYECYKIAWETALKCLGHSHPLTISMQTTFKNAENLLQDRGIRSTMRETKKEIAPATTRVRYKSAGKRVPSRGTIGNEIKTLRITAKVSKDLQIPKHPNKPTFSLSETADLKETRFLTGDRMQPMYQNEFRMKSLPRAAVKIRKEGPKIHHEKTNSNPISIDKDKTSKITDKIKKFDMKISEFDNLIQDIEPGLNYENIEKMLVKHHKENAAIKIQKNYRGYQVRKFTKVYKHRRTSRNSDTVSQALKDLEIFKNNVDNSKFPQISADILGNQGLEIIPEIPDMSTPMLINTVFDSILSVQAMFRGVLIRNEMARKIKAAIVIQKRVRGYLCLVIYKSIREAIICIQAFYRRVHKRENVNKPAAKIKN